MKEETLLPDVASLEKVLEWIAGLPVPTKLATANYCRLKNFIIDYNAALQSGNSGQPVTVPDGLRLALSNAGIAAPESDDMLFATHEKYVQLLVDWVKERKPFMASVDHPTKCWCRSCRPVTLSDMRFVVCPDCGNKRCPKANDHRNSCTGSNEPGQPGSAYSDAPKGV